MMHRVVAAAVFAVGFTAGTHAQPIGDRDAGRDLASTWCSNCHAIGERAPQTATDAVPSFRSVAALPSTTPLSIRAFLRSSHPVMPNLSLTDTQIDDLGAYILSLRPPGNRS